MFEGHQGPVTGISCHSAVGTVDFSHLFITSSFDWTVKLWSTKVSRVWVGVGVSVWRREKMAEGTDVWGVDCGLWKVT